MQMQARELQRQAREAAEKAARMAGAAAAAAGMGADPSANIAGAPPVVPGLDDTLSSLPQLEAFNGPVVEAETLAGLFDASRRLSRRPRRCVSRRCYLRRC